MRINDSLRFPNRDAADRAARKLAEEGSDVIWAIDAEPRGEVERTRDRMQQLASELDGDVLGGGSSGMLLLAASRLPEFMRIRSHLHAGRIPSSGTESAARPLTASTPSSPSRGRRARRFEP